MHRLMVTARLGRSIAGATRSGMPHRAVKSEPHITAILPAHNEEQNLLAAVSALRAQTLRPARIIVIADNCTDATVQVAARLGVDVMETVENTHKKAGALNQVLGMLLPHLPGEHLVLVMDADSTIVPLFLEVAVAALNDRRDIGAIGGVFYGEPGGGLVGALQRNEYTRYAREIGRKGGRCVVLTGTASLFRAATLRAVGAQRGRRLPGRPDSIYDTLALTEDNEITLAVKTLGMATLSPRECVVVTEIMDTWAALWQQRLRWQRGAMENLRHYGLTRITLPYMVRQLAMYLGILAVSLFLLSSALFAAIGLLQFPTGWWLGLTGLFVVERMWTVRRCGWRAVVLAAPVVIEFGYDLFQQAVYLRAAIDMLFRRTTDWHHAPNTRTD